MSDEIDLSNSPLCTTEDAFEKFQSVSMYEEEEYITLSDIMPPPPVAPDFSGQLNDIPYESEVVLDSNLEEQVPEVNSTIEIGTEDHLTGETSCEDRLSSEEPVQTEQHIENVEEVPQPISELNEPSKRERKKKSLQNESLTTNIEDQNGVSDVVSQDNEAIAAVPTTQRRRGRPPKKLCQSVSVTGDPLVDVPETPGDIPKRACRRRLSNRMSSQNNNDTPNDNSPPRKVPGKRGRPKKNILESHVNTDSNCVTELDQQDVSLSKEQDVVLQIKKKRGRKKKSQISVDEEIDEPCDIPLDQGSSNILSDPSLKKTPSKKGRPRKIQTEKCDIIEKNQVEPVLEKHIEDDDDADDICLSQLRNTLEDTKDTSNVETITLEENAESNGILESKIEEVPLEIVLVPSEISEQAPLTVEQTENNAPAKRNSKQPLMQDFEYNIDSIVTDRKEDLANTADQLKENDENNDSLLVEDTSKRPIRRKVTQSLHYDEESDEDPFANVELSDEDDMRGRKGRYYSDDEYIPGVVKRGSKHVEISAESDTSDSDIDKIDDEISHLKRKRGRKSDGSPYKKRGRKTKEELQKSKTSLEVLMSKPHDKDMEANDVEVLETSPYKKRGRKSKEELQKAKTLPEVSISKPDDKDMEVDDVEVCLETSVIKAPEESKPKNWGNSHEFEDFLAKKIQGTDIKIKKSSTPVQPLDIPVINPNEAKKTAERHTQTAEIKTASAEIQTTPPYDVPMKSNISLTADQSEKACEFLNSIVKTTAELGELMTQKSEDFIKKKINTNNVTDTFKMDYCVRKSFLLFKLAKHNLMQMEDDLAKKYDDFLNTNNLSQYRETPKTLEAEKKVKDSDSDCEIIEAPAPTVQKKKVVPFNPKTVFLNKELSIKIAKKPTDDKKLNIKGRHTVWISDSVMVKKVKPTQSFLAQDSRNKKPPDCVTIEMVNAFFQQYYREKALVTCAPFVTSDWITQKRVYVCNYFFANTDDFPNGTGMPSGSGHCEDADNNLSTSDENDNFRSTSANEKGKSSPKTLFSLCIQVLQNDQQTKKLKISYKSVKDSSGHSLPNYVPETLCQMCINNINDNVRAVNKKPPSLKTLCHKTIMSLLCSSNQLETDNKVKDYSSESHTHNYVNDFTIDSIPKSPLPVDRESSETDLEKRSNSQKVVKSLFSLCYNLINIHLNGHMEPNLLYKKPIEKELSIVNDTPKSLKCFAYEQVVNLLFNDKVTKVSNKYATNETLKKVKTLADLCFEIISKAFTDTDNQTPRDGLTINDVNTLTEEDYHNIDQSELPENAGDYYLDDDSNVYDDGTEGGFDNTDENDHVENNWMSQVQMEISSCYDPNNSVSLNPAEKQVEIPFNGDSIVAHIKQEPVEELSETIDTSIVKSEPVPHLDEMTIIPEGIETKTEYMDPPVSSREPMQRQNSSSFDVEQFEAFVSTNKMMYNINNYDNENEEIFSQSVARIRRQHEPDSDTENDMNMSLLIPQTYEPVPIIEKNKAKNSLMESSSDENTTNNYKKGTKKKYEKRSRGRPKKNELKLNKEMTTEKPATNEIAVLTRRMRTKIRQEEKKVASSDSERETNDIIPKKGKEKLKPDKVKTSQPEESNDKEKEDTADEIKEKEIKAINDEIQCSNVDSTEQGIETFRSVSKNVSPDLNNFSGFTAVDQNEITSYQKYVKYVYDQILPRVTEGDKRQSQGDIDQPIINSDEPIELLECEPTIPCLIGEPEQLPTPVTKKSKTSKKQKCKENTETNVVKPDEKENVVPSANDIPREENVKYVERHGWKCYPLDGNDRKLYQDAQILLEKLPETFVETYFRYKDVTNKSREDEEVERLTNLQTLNRTSGKEDVAEEKSKTKGRLKCKIQPQVKDAVFSILGLNDTADDVSRPPSPANSDRCEFTPSEDEGGKLDDETPPPVVKRASENNLAKSSLMDDSDNESKIKSEPKDPEDDTNETQVKHERKYKPGPKCKKLKETIPSEAMMLTADKMMNKELNLLHAPVKLDEDVKIKIPLKTGPVTRNKNKNMTKTSPKDRIKTEDDSSSDEEKQWFTIKEKLLKRMMKKHDTTSEDDAKRAKIVSEFIERRGDGTESYIKKRRGGIRGRRSKKKLLERQKQLKVLTRELFGDASNDTSLQRKKQAVSSFKGRRNIRKVIDKKLLAKSTVVANMEEFERKRRLTTRQSKLREVLRCEEGVNVLVINDEVCLEYDFEQHRPVVTIHPFFTKVMKAHQYEGVKFMWDACFESLESIAAGHPGSGCILAHCMGLGKTLQVLALLHTVLTHPGVGMQRVLVCCPLSTVLNWVDEIHKWIGPVTNKIKVFELSKLRKTYERAYQLEDWYNGGGIFIIGYELFRSLTTLDPFLDDVRPTIVNKIRTALLDPGPDIIICDEGHLLKNDCSVLAVAMSRVMTRRRIVLTGTPMQNNLREYYCMVNFVKPNLLGTYSEYSNRFENPIMNGQHRDSSEEDIKLMKARTHILHKVLEGCLQRQEASVLHPYLPKKHEYTVFISLTKCQWDLYKHYLINYSNTQNNKSILKDFHILQKIWSHPQVLHNFQMRVADEAKAKTKVKVEKLEDDLASEDLKETVDVKPSDNEVWWLQYLDGMLDSLTSSNKFVAVFRILDECVALGDKVLIFSTSLFTMDSLEFFLKKIKNWSLGQEYYRLDGSVPAEVRQKWCREFNAENNLKTKLFLISTRAGCLGLNMTAANRVIILDTSWNPAHDIQSIFRVYRFGQKKDCFIYRLVALGTMEQKIYERSVRKQAVACRVIDEQQIDRHYNMADLTELYKYDESGLGVAGGVAVGVGDVALLRVAREAGLHAVHEHDSLLRGSGEQGLPEHERDAAWMQFQQEHARKQIMEEELQRASLTQAPKRPPRQYAKLKIPVATDVDVESILPEPMPPSSLSPASSPQPPLQPRPARQRGRKARTSAVVSCRIPIQPEAAEASDPGDEVAMVRQIANILLQHNYQNTKSASEVSELAARVRRVVSSGRLDQLDSTDELTMRLASVFRQSGGVPMPALTDVTPEPRPGPSAVRDEPKPRGRRKGSRRTKFVYEEDVEAGPSPPPPLVVPAEATGARVRRKAALAAERNFDEVVDSVIDVMDDEWQNDDYHPVRSPAGEVVRADNGRNAPAESVCHRKNYASKKPGPATKTIPPEVVDAPRNVDQDNTILLSDDEGPAPPRRKPGPKRKTRVRESSPPKEVVASQEKKTEIPLHPTLLSNKNFIKIVAHTYLSGNPMLDEDAATLAAQYSTFKALKEYESTGKDIISGPIHDIAVQVLGLGVLEKLYTSNPKIVTSEVIASHPINAKVAPASEPPAKPTAPSEPAAPPKQPVKIRIRIPPLPAGLAAGPATGPGPTAAPRADVVPVGLYKRAEEGPSQTADECILPDDDDVRIVTDDPAPPPAPLAPADPESHSRVILGRRNSKRFIIRKINSGPAPATAPPPPPPPPPVPVLVPTPAPAAPAENILSDLTPTISLDSDDDERAPPAPAPPPAPVPVSLTKVVVPKTRKLVCKIAPVSRHGGTPVSLAPSVDSQPSSTGQPSFILIPSGNISAASAAAPAALGSGQAPPPQLKRVPADAVPTAVHNAAAGLGVPSSDLLKLAASKRLCKPGDILRISQSGKVEVLKRSDVTTTETSSLKPAAPTLQSQAKRGASTTTSSVSARPAPGPGGAALTTSGGGGSQDVADEGPLSILKDVVQISANKYDCSAPPVSKSVTSSKQTTKTVSSAPAQPKSGKTVKAGDKEKVDGKWHQVLSHNSKKSEQVQTTKKTPQTVRKEQVVDLTDLDGASAAKATTALKRTTVVGTSKSIILCGSGKTISLKDPTKLGTPSTSKNKIVIKKLDAKSKIVIAKTKRPAPAEDTAAKKKKTDKPMTLKDFDIDDIDDIIELE